VSIIGPIGKPVIQPIVTPVGVVGLPWETNSTGAPLLPPGAPTISLGSTFTIGGTITWSAVPGATGYQRYRDGLATGAITSPHTIVAADCCNAFTVAATNAAGAGPQSNALGQIAPSACGDTNFLGGAAGTAAMDLGSGRTLIVVLDPSDAAPQTPATGWTVLSATAGLAGGGWALFIRSNGDAPRVGMFYNRGAGFTEVTNLGTLSRTPGKPLRIVFVDNSTTFRVSVNGSPIVSAARAAYQAIGAGDLFALGKFGGLATYGDDHNRVSSFAILSRAVSDAEAIAESGILGSWAIGLSTDAACTIDAHASRDYPSGGATWVTQGSAPITLTKAGTVTVAQTSADAYPATTLTRPDDTGIWSPVTSCGVTYNRCTQQARWTIDTDAEEIVVQRISTEGAPYYSDVCVRIVGGATPTPIVYQGAYGYPYPLSARFSLGSGGSAKVVELVASVQSTIDALATFLGDFPYQINVPFGRTATVRAATRPTRRLVVYGDSMAAERTDAPELHGPFGLVRLDYPGQVTIDAGLNRALYEDLNGGIGQSALVAQLVAEADGTVRNDFWLMIGLEDHWRSLWTARSDFTTAYHAFLVALVAAVQSAGVPDPHFWVQTRTDADAPYNTDNAGESVAQWKTAQSDACTGIAEITVVDGASLATFNSTNFDAADVATAPNRVHWTTVGAAVAKTAIKAAIGY